MCQQRLQRRQKVYVNFDLYMHTLHTLLRHRIFTIATKTCRSSVCRTLILLMLSNRELKVWNAQWFFHKVGFVGNFAPRNCMRIAISCCFDRRNCCRTLCQPYPSEPHWSRISRLLFLRETEKILSRLISDATRSKVYKIVARLRAPFLMNSWAFKLASFPTLALLARWWASEVTNSRFSNETKYESIDDEGKNWRFRVARRI